MPRITQLKFGIALSHDYGRVYPNEIVLFLRLKDPPDIFPSTRHELCPCPKWMVDALIDSYGINQCGFQCGCNGPSQLASQYLSTGSTQSPSLMTSLLMYAAMNRQDIKPELA